MVSDRGSYLVTWHDAEGKKVDDALIEPQVMRGIV
jgi:hypothetical protein